MICVGVRAADGRAGAGGAGLRTWGVDLLASVGGAAGPRADLHVHGDHGATGIYD
jgi:hypothetical protein